MSTGIRVACVRCGAQIDSSERDSGGRCRTCGARQAVAALVQEIERIDAKRIRYQARGVDVTSMTRQLVRLTERLGRELAVRLGDPNKGAALQRQMLEDLHGRVLSRGSRIQVARGVMQA